MLIFANLKYFGKEEERTLDVKRVHQMQKIRFTLIGLAMASTAFDFIDNLNIDCSMSNATTKSTLGTHISKLPTFLGWKYASLITYKCLTKLAFASSYIQYCGYTTPMLSIISITP
jgi:hypothetical protein